MSRLYYETKAVEKKEEVSEDEVFGGDDVQTGEVEKDDQQNGQSKVNSYLEKVASLVPAEVIAGYLTIFGLIPAIGAGKEGFEEIHGQLFWGSYALCQILTPIYLNSQAEKGKPKVVHLIISTIAFAVWAYVTTGKELVENYYDAAGASILLVVFSLISGTIRLKK